MDSKLKSSEQKLYYCSQDSVGAAICKLAFNYHSKKLVSQLL